MCNHLKIELGGKDYDASYENKIELGGKDYDASYENK